MQIYQRLKEIRKENNKTQEQIGALINTTKQQYYLYESGKRELKATQIFIICKYLNISADYLLGLTDKKSRLIKAAIFILYTN